MRREPRGLLAAALGVFGVAAIVAYGILAVTLGRGFAIPVGIVGVCAVGGILVGPLGKALARRLEGIEPPSEAPPEQLLAELDEVRGRLEQLEERVDFSERLLAQQSRVPER